MKHADPPLKTTELALRELKRKNRRAFLIAALSSLGGLAGLASIWKMDKERGLPWFLRGFVQLEDSFWKDRFDEKALAPPVQKEGDLRLNGDVGMERAIDPSTWRLQVMSPEYEDPLFISLNEIKNLPAVTESFEFKCIEGWSQDVECRGVRFRDFMRAHDLAAFPYAQLTSVNGGYYVSMDAKSLLHPQTLLCYELNGEPLTAEHGAPLRLMTSVKYGVKSIKQIGRIAFSETPPADYWAELGYGDFLGL